MGAARGGETALEGVAFARVDLDEDGADVLRIFGGGALQRRGGAVTAAVIDGEDLEGDVSAQEVGDGLDVALDHVFEAVSWHDDAQAALGTEACLCGTPKIFGVFSGHSSGDK